MSESMQIWLFGGIYAVAIAYAGNAFVTAQRITRLETFFEVFGKKAAQILHSPHTPELDYYLDKYIKNNMAETDWHKLLHLCEALEVCLMKPKEERVLAAIIAVHCRKRLNLPLPGFHPHTETTTIPELEN